MRSPEAGTCRLPVESEVGLTPCLYQQDVLDWESALRTDRSNFLGALAPEVRA